MRENSPFLTCQIWFSVKTHWGLITNFYIERLFSIEIKLPIFPRLVHKNGYGLLFHPIDALRTVNDHEDQLQVAMAEEWQKARYMLIVLRHEETYL
jgi:hypothetical protein